jgi:hypothetical protein
MMREFNTFTSPVRVGLIIVAAMVFGVIFARVIAMSGKAEVRADTTLESVEPITQGIGGIRGLRGSLP